MDKMYLYATDGLCNRLLAIDSAISLSQDVNRELTVIWNKNENLNCAFNQLFKPIQGVEVIETSSTSSLLPGLKINQFPKMNPESKKGILSAIRRLMWNKQRKKMNVRGTLFYDELLKVHLENPSSQFAGEKERRQKIYEIVYEMVKGTLHDGFANYLVSCWRLYSDVEWYRNFIPIDQLQERINKITDNYSNTIGLHIRRTDHKAAIMQSGLGKFIDKMEKEMEVDEKINFFLATDDKETEQVVMDRFKDKILINKKYAFSRNSVEGIHDAVVDLYCLSKTKKILGSAGSTFTKVAAEISGIEVLIA